MNAIDRLKGIMDLKPKKILLISPSREKYVYVAFTDQYMILQSRSVYKRDVGVHTYTHDIHTGEFLHSHLQHGNIRHWERITKSIYAELCKIYTT